MEKVRHNIYKKRERERKKLTRPQSQTQSNPFGTFKSHLTFYFNR